MIFDNVAPPEVAQKHICSFYKSLGISDRDDVMWLKLSCDERLVFCRLAGVGESNSTKQFSLIKPDTRTRILRAIKRMGQVANSFQNTSIPNVRYRSSGAK